MGCGFNDVFPEHMFFYGTLKTGFHNHKKFAPLLSKYDGKSEGSAKAPMNVVLFSDMYGCPYAAFDDNLNMHKQESDSEEDSAEDSPRRAAVKGELFRFVGGVPAEVLSEMDILESAPERYQRRIVKVQDAASGNTIVAWVYGIDAEKVPGLLDGNRYELIDEYTEEFHRTKYTPRELRDPEFKRSWGGYTPIA
eukprot:gnl/TRDRNA2_/TRDRNA2_59207_c0_seq1.p1 gnl/TRDRNA2_/TRDRNA2_59207_c0~~gnl/TRDRNA2_/TRDRNA2_59207_c0_seq1.p1  ORF type:complete len:194 (+),score=47.47 gnl/TRDRNA2_/TRDRNA2_59207_c0_seq1:104-685(+)